MTAAKPLRIPFADSTLSGLFLRPVRARVAVCLAHGAGAGMTHPFMEAVAAGLADRGGASLRFQFPFMEAGGRRPDRPAVAQAAVRAAVDVLRKLAPDLPLVAGGKSFGGRMTATAQAEDPLPGVRGLLFLGFPLHPAGKPATVRAAPLGAIAAPMLVVQGTRDALAEFELLAGVVRDLGARATLVPIAEADHGFHVPRRSGRTDESALTEALEAISAWAERLE